MEPSKRVETLQKFAARITGTAATSEELKRFNMKLNPQLVEFNGRKLPPEKVTLGKEVYCNQQADWTQCKSPLNYHQKET